MQLPQSQHQNDQVGIREDTICTGYHLSLADTFDFSALDHIQQSHSLLNTSLDVTQSVCASNTNSIKYTNL